MLKRISSELPVNILSTRYDVIAKKINSTKLVEVKNETEDGKIPQEAPTLKIGH